MQQALVQVSTVMVCDRPLQLPSSSARAVRLQAVLLMELTACALCPAASTAQAPPIVGADHYTSYLDMQPNNAGAAGILGQAHHQQYEQPSHEQQWQQHGQQQQQQYTQYDQNQHYSQHNANGNSGTAVLPAVSVGEEAAFFGEGEMTELQL